MSASRRRGRGTPLRRLARPAAGIAIVASLALTACSAGTGSADSSSDEPQDFTFSSWNYGEDAQKALIEEEVSGFADEQGVNVDLVSYPYAEYRNQILLRSRDGSTTGAAQLDIADIQSLAQLGVLEDLTSYADGVDYTDAALRNGQVDGVQYGLPWYTGSIGLIENEQILADAGITEMPKTVDEFEDALKAVKALGGDIVPYALATKPETIKDFIPWFRTFGSKIVDDGEISINDDGAVAALEWLTKLNDEGLITLGLGRPEARTLYAQGKAAFFDDANQVRGTLTAQAEDPTLLDHTVPVQRPVVQPGDAPQSLAWGGLIVVFKKGPAHTAADFAKYYTSTPEIGINRYEQIGSVPTTETALADPSFTNDAYASTWQSQITDSASPNPLWQFPNYSQMEAKLAEQIQAALTGQTSAQDALDTAQAEMQKLVD
ncbi:ABC transporter substrate-binding protein [Agromyces sp. SYSU T00266]|uniref:ABC transporter substrate-binding protein n=1 Tax=Agromyces zhanjiangensis TaxID=3158562 RepID=UPI00339A80C9